MTATLHRIQLISHHNDFSPGVQWSPDRVNQTSCWHPISRKRISDISRRKVVQNFGSLIWISRQSRWISLRDQQVMIHLIQNYAIRGGSLTLQSTSEWHKKSPKTNPLTTALTLQGRLPARNSNSDWQEEGTLPCWPSLPAVRSLAPNLKIYLDKLVNTNDRCYCEKDWLESVRSFPIDVVMDFEM